MEKTDVFNDVKVKGILDDYAKGEYKKEIRLLLQAIGLGWHTAILKPTSSNHIKEDLLEKFQAKYPNNEADAAELFDLLRGVLLGYSDMEKTKAKGTVAPSPPLPSVKETVVIVPPDKGPKGTVFIESSNMEEINLISTYISPQAYAYFHSGMEHKMKGEYESAIADLTKAYKLSAHPRFYWLLQACHLGRDRP
jgi:hypothetical protein